MAEPMVKKAVRREGIFTQDEIQRRRYELIEKAEHDRIGQMDYAIKQGREEGEDKLNMLFTFLVNDGKLNEIPKVLNNKNLRHELYLKYNIK